MNFIRNRNFRAGPQTSLEGVICPQNSDKQQKIKVFGRSGGERPRTSAYNSELLQSESLAEVSCPVSSKVGPFLGRLNSHISKDAYKLKVEELKTDVLGRAGGERPRTSAYNSELLQSESLAEVSCPVSSKVGPFLGRLNSHISKDAYKLKVEELKTDVLGRAGGGLLPEKGVLQKKKHRKISAMKN